MIEGQKYPEYSYPIGQDCVSAGQGIPPAPREKSMMERICALEAMINERDKMLSRQDYQLAKKAHYANPNS